MEMGISRRGLMLLAYPTILATIAVIAMLLSFLETNETPDGTLEVAKLFLAKGDLKGAERALRKLSGTEARFQLGSLLAKTGRWAEAQPILIDCLSSLDKREEALQLLAQGA